MNEFLRDRSGNFAIISALLTVPLVFAVGLGLEYSDMGAERTRLQNALDTAALAVAREGVKISDVMAYKIADDYVRSNFAGNLDKVTVTRSGNSVSVTASTLKKMTFGSIMGKQNRKITAQSIAEYAPTQYELSLVLDTTGSMEGVKLSAMKDAVNTLIDAMSVQVTHKSALKVGVVPYATFVNVGPQHGPEFTRLGTVRAPAVEWLDTMSEAPIPQSDLPEGTNRFALFDHLGTMWPGCVETRMATQSGNHDVDDTEPTASDPATLFTPAFAIDEPDDTYSNGVPKYPNSYLDDASVPAGDGIAEERISRYGAPRNSSRPRRLKEWITYLSSWKKNRVDRSPSRFYSNESDPKGPGYGCETEPLLPLTSDLSSVRKKVDVLKANGSTNITEGVMWGWRILSDREPFTEGSAKKSGVRKIMVVLTDGSNSFGVLNNKLKSGYTSMGYLVDGRLDGLTAGSGEKVNAEMNRKTLAACTNAKNDGIEIFTIRLEEPNVATGTLLQKCASGNDHFFDSPNHEQLKPIFEEIKDRLVMVRLAA